MPLSEENVTSEQFKVGQIVWHRHTLKLSGRVVAHDESTVWIKGQWSNTSFLAPAYEFTAIDPNQPAEPMPQRCPFCGSAPRDLKDKTRFYYSCGNCVLCGPNKATRLEAIAAWNSIGVLSAPIDQRLVTLLVDAQVAQEREACAKIAEDLRPKDNFLGGYSVQDLKRAAADDIAAAIRKRGQQ